MRKNNQNKIKKENEENEEKDDNGGNKDLRGATSRKELSKSISFHKKITYDDGDEEKKQEN